MTPKLVCRCDRCTGSSSAPASPERAWTGSWRTLRDQASTAWRSDQARLLLDEFDRRGALQHRARWRPGRRSDPARVRRMQALAEAGPGRSGRKKKTDPDEGPVKAPSSPSLAARDDKAIGPWCRAAEEPGRTSSAMGPGAGVLQLAVLSACSALSSTTL